VKGERESVPFTLHPGSDRAFPPKRPTIVPELPTILSKIPMVPPQLVTVAPELSRTRRRIAAITAQFPPILAQLAMILPDVPLIPHHLPSLMPVSVAAWVLRGQRRGAGDHGAGEEEAREQLQTTHMRILVEVRRVGRVQLHGVRAVRCVTRGP
jgi:hypothetical protein